MKKTSQLTLHASTACQPGVIRAKRGNFSEQPASKKKLEISSIVPEIVLQRNKNKVRFQLKYRFSRNHGNLHQAFATLFSWQCILVQTIQNKLGILDLNRSKNRIQKI